MGVLVHQMMNLANTVYGIYKYALVHQRMKTVTAVV